MRKYPILLMLLLLVSIPNLAIATEIKTWDNPLTLVNFSFPQGQRHGIKIYTNTSVNLTKLVKYEFTGATACYVYNTSGKLVATSTNISGNDCYFSPALTLNVSQNYSLLFNSSGDGDQMHGYASSTDNDNSSSKIFVWFMGVYSDGDGINLQEYQQLYDVEEVWIETTKFPTGINLTLNDNDTNTTTFNYTLIAKNLTALANETGVPVNITINDTEVANGTTSATIDYVFPVGYWNVTGYTIGTDNYSASSSAIWVNVTPAVPTYSITFNPNNSIITYGSTILVSCANIPAQITGVTGFYNDTSLTDASYYFNTSLLLGGGVYNLTCNNTATANYSAFSVNRSLTVQAKIMQNVTATICFNIGNLENCFGYNTTDISTFSTRSEIKCSDNSTLSENITITDAGNTTSALHYIECNDGCDNVTNTCNPPEYQQTLITFGVILVLFAGFFILFRWVS